MSLTYTDLCNFGKPVVGNSLNIWGTEENDTIDLLDQAIISNNFAQDASNHSGLNFYYKNGIIANGTTVNNVIAGYITLSDSATNYIEVDIDGNVTSNTTSFTIGKMPLFTAVTLSGEITTVVDKRCYSSIPISQLFTSDGTTVTTNQQFTVTGVLSTDANSNVLINGASSETNQEGGLSLKQGAQNPTTNTADQITLFATSGGDSTLGLVTESGLSNNLLPTSINNETRYLYARKNSINPISGFMTSTVSVVNTVDETTIMTMTLGGKTDPAGQLIKIKFTGDLSSAVASHQNSTRIYIGSATNTIYSNVSSVLTNEYTIMDYILYIRSASSYAYQFRASFGDYSWTGRGTVSSQDFTNDVILKVTSQWNTADAGSQCDFYGGCFEVCI